MPYLFGYNTDGADYQARAVLAYLSGKAGVECSWDKEHEEYSAKPRVARWHNCREQGYVIMLSSIDYRRQLNIAFFEHRNSDAICAVEWEQITINPPTIDTMKTGDAIYKDKYDLSHEVGYGKAADMAEWLFERLIVFWLATSTAKDAPPTLERAQ